MELVYYLKKLYKNVSISIDSLCVSVCVPHRVTDRAVEPLQIELAELDQVIRDQQDRICAVKSNILRNEEKIHKMVTGIGFSSRT